MRRPRRTSNNLHWTLSRITNYTGVMNYMGARFAADPGAMAPVMAELGKRGLLYLDDGSSARSVAPELALKNGVPFAAGDAAIDAVRERGDILKKLDELEATARAKGFAIGTGSAFDVTVDAVIAWVDEAKKRGIEIVPISAVAIDPEKRLRLAMAKKPVDPETLPYRPCVGIMVLNRDGLVWVGHRIADGEFANMTARRSSGRCRRAASTRARIRCRPPTASSTRRPACESVTLLAEAPDWINYDLPPRPGRHRAEGQISRPDAEMVRLPLRRRRKRDRASTRRPAATRPNSTAGRGSRWPNCRS